MLNYQRVNPKKSQALKQLSLIGDIRDVRPTTGGVDGIHKAHLHGDAETNHGFLQP